MMIFLHGIEYIYTILQKHMKTDNDFKMSETQGMGAIAPHYPP